MYSEEDTPTRKLHTAAKCAAVTLFVVMLVLGAVVVGIDLIALTLRHL